MVVRTFGCLWGLFRFGSGFGWLCPGRRACPFQIRIGYWSAVLVWSDSLFCFRDLRLSPVSHCVMIYLVPQQSVCVGSGEKVGLSSHWTWTLGHRCHLLAGSRFVSVGFGLAVRAHHLRLGGLLLAAVVLSALERLGSAPGLHRLCVPSMGMLWPAVFGA